MIHARDFHPFGADFGGGLDQPIKKVDTVLLLISRNAVEGVIHKVIRADRRDRHLGRGN
ncbi:MAG: hypothetical protein U0231_14760 [Nitrospiraceae bacterium]